MASAGQALVAPVMEIIPASFAMLVAEELGGYALAAFLEVASPRSWPPALNGPETRAWMRQFIADHPDRPGFGTWYIVADNRLVGVFGCMGQPDIGAVVKIGYSIVTAEQGKCYARAAVGQLLAHVDADPRVATVTA